MENRPRLGIIGGMGSVAAAHFFKRLVELTPAKTDQDYIETFLYNNSQIPDRTAGLLYGQPSPLPELIRSIELLNRVGVDYIVLACLTSHYFMPQLREHSKAAILDGIALTAERCRDLGLQKVGVMATNGTTKLGLFQEQLHKLGINALVMNDADQEKYFTEPVYAPWGIKAGTVTGLPKERVHTGAQILIDAGAEAIIAGCTELPLVMAPAEFSVPLIDAVEVLLEHTIRQCLHAGIRSGQSRAAQR